MIIVICWIVLSTCVTECDLFLFPGFAGTRIKLAPLHESEKQQLQRFCNACKGIPQVEIISLVEVSLLHVLRVARGTSRYLLTI